MGNSVAPEDMVVGLGRASLPANNGLGAEGPEMDADLTLIGLGGLFLESVFQIDPPQFRLNGCVAVPLLDVTAAAHADVSPEGVVGNEVVGESPPPFPNTE